MILNLNPIFKILFEQKEVKPEKPEKPEKPAEQFYIGRLIGEKPGDEKLRELLQKYGTGSDDQKEEAKKTKGAKGPQEQKRLSVREFRKQKQKLEEYVAELGTKDQPENKAFDEFLQLQQQYNDKKERFKANIIRKGKEDLFKVFFPDEKFAEVAQKYPKQDPAVEDKDSDTLLDEYYKTIEKSKVKPKVDPEVLLAQLIGEKPVVGEKPIIGEEPSNEDIKKMEVYNKQVDKLEKYNSQKGVLIDRLKAYIVKLGREDLFNNLFPDESFKEAAEKDSKEDPRIFEEKALDAFIRYEGRYKYLGIDYSDREKCKNSEEFKKYLNMAKTIDYFSEVIEGNASLQDLALENAYKMLVLFPPKGSTFEQFDKCFQAIQGGVQNKEIVDSHQPIHDLFLKSLPEGIKHLDLWRALIADFPDAMPAILKDMGLFPSIERLWGKSVPQKKDMSPNRFNVDMSKISFARYNEAPELVAFLTKLRIKDENIFNRALDLVKQNKLHFQPGSRLQFAGKKDDKIPDISISASELDLKDKTTGKQDPTTTGYYWVKLPNGDPRGLILGHITGCCQLVTGHSEQCVIDGMNMGTSGFYVLLKVKKPDEFSADKFKDPKWWENMEANAEIKAQSYVWRSIQGNLVMDSLEGFKAESKDKLSDTAMLALLKKFGEKLEGEGIDRLSLGCGGDTPDFLKEYPSDFPEKMQEGTQYGDSFSQVIIHESARLIKVKSELLAKFPNQNLNILASIQQVELFAHLPAAQSKTLNKLPVDEFKIYVSVAYGFNDPRDFSSAVAKLFELKSNNTQKYLALTSENALEVYMTGRVAVDDLILLDDLYKIKLLTSAETRKALKHGQGAASILKDLTVDEIKMLTSCSADEIYETGEITMENLKALLGDAAKFDLFTSALALEAFGPDVVDLNFKELAAKDIPTICAVFFEMSKVEGDHIKISEIKSDPANFAGFDSECIKLLTSHEAAMAYKTGHVFPGDFKGLNADTIRKLIHSAQALKAYEIGHVKAADLVNVDLSRLPELISDRAILAYSTGKVSVTDLKDADDELRRDLISHNACKAYRTGKVSAADLKDLTSRMRHTLISNQVIGAYKAGVSVSDLKNLEADEILELTTPGANNVFATGKVTFADLKELLGDSEKLSIFTSELGRKALDKAPADFDFKRLAKDSVENIVATLFEMLEIKNLTGLAKATLQQINILTSSEAILAYESGKVSPADLLRVKGGNVEVMKQLIESDVVRAYESDKVTISDLKDLSVSEIKQLFSPQALKAYSTGKVSVTILSDAILKGLNREAINMLISDQALKAYETGKVSVEVLIVAVLSGLGSERISRIISDRAIEAFHAGNFSAELLLKVKNLNIGAIEALISSSSAIQAYQTGKVSAAQLVSLETEAILKFTSWQALKVYETYSAADLLEISTDTSVLCELINFLSRAQDNKVEIPLADLKGLSAEMLELLNSDSASAMLATGKIKIADLNDLFLNSDSDIFYLLTSPLALAALEQAPQRFHLKSLTKNDIITITTQLLDMVGVKAQPADFEGAGIDRILQLTSPRVLQCYKDTNVTVKDLKDCTAQEIQNIISEGGLLLLKFGKATVADLRAFNFDDYDRFNVLANASAQEAYTTGKVTFADLKDLKADQIKSILNALHLLTDELATIDDLKNLHSTALRNFERKPVIEAIKAKLLSVADFVGIVGYGKLNELTSHLAIEAYKTGKVTVRDLKDEDVDKISELISRQAVAAYKSGKLSSHDLIEKDVDEIREILSSKENIDMFCAQRDAKETAKEASVAGHQKFGVFGGAGDAKTETKEVEESQASTRKTPTQGEH